MSENVVSRAKLKDGLCNSIFFLCLILILAHKAERGDGWDKTESYQPTDSAGPPVEANEISGGMTNTRKLILRDQTVCKSLFFK